MVNKFSNPALLYAYTGCTSLIFMLPVIIPFYNHQLGLTFQDFLPIEKQGGPTCVGGSVLSCRVYGNVVGECGACAIQTVCIETTEDPRVTVLRQYSL